jgi:signal transduction histidine kinase
MSIRERAEDIEAEFSISSTHGLGTIVETVISLDGEP